MKLKGLYLLNSTGFGLVYGVDEQRDIARLVDIYAPPQTSASVRKSPRVLADADVIFSGWGMSLADRNFLNAAPRLRAIFYAAGATGGWSTPDLWDRGIVVTTAQTANSVPVAEYTLATILFSLKHGWRLARESREAHTFVERNDVPGCYRRTVGLISLGVIGRMVLNLLRSFDLEILVHDPLLDAEDARRLGVEQVSLTDVFLRSDVVSLHTPHLPETEGLITGEHLSSMRPGATFINTARGEIVREIEMIEVLRRRHDLQAVLDVTFPEPPTRGSPLYTLPNVVLTPHIAGSAGHECRRMGRCMVEELERYLSGQSLKWAINPDASAASSHRPAHSLSVPPGESLRTTTLISHA